MIRGNDPAFPRPVSEDTTNGSQTDGNRTVGDQCGMSFRQYAAVAAMNGLVLYRSSDGQEPPSDVIAGWAVQYADALIKELNK